MSGIANIQLSNRRTIASIAFICFQLLTATLFIRPAEMFEVFRGWPIYESLILGTLFLSANSVDPHFRRPAMLRQPITPCLIGLAFAIAVSHMSHLFVSGAIESTIMFVKIIIYYGLLITVVNSPTRLTLFMANVAICTTLMSTLCVLDYWEWNDLEFITHVKELDQEETDESDATFRIRICGMGIFEDPNDLSMVIVAAGTLCLHFLCNKSFHALRWLWLFPLFALTIALLETKSRGGMLAAGAATIVWLSLKYGRQVAIVAGIAGVMVLPLVAGRSAKIEFGEHSTATHRIEMWREGFEALRSSDLLFGIGQGLYGDLAGLVAHNSYLHAYVELGLCGGTLFFGCFYFAIVQLQRIALRPEKPYIQELTDMYPTIAAMLAGWMVSLFSLSRCYTVPTYLIVGMCATYCNLVWIHTPPARPLIFSSLRDVRGLAASSAVMFIGLYVFMRIMV